MLPIRIHSQCSPTGLGLLALLICCAGCGGSITTAQTSTPAAPPLVTGRYISPQMRSLQGVGSMPMNAVISPDGKFLITTDMGNQQALWSIRTSDSHGVSHVDFSTKVENGKSNDAQKSAQPPVNGEAVTESTSSGSQKSNGLYYGLAFSKDGTLYAAQGGHDSVAVLSLDAEGALKLVDSIPTRKKDFPAGVALDDRGRLYVANNASGDGNPLRLSGSLAVYDLQSKKELGRYTFTESHGGTSNFPYAVVVLRDGGKTYVASERDDCVYVIDTSDAANPKLSATVTTGAHPVALLMTKDQSQLFVANSLGDTVSMIDAKTDRVIDTIMLRPAIVRDLPGVSPTAVALSPDEKTLYVTLSDMNAVAVIDIDDREVRGYVPAGWYPSAVVVTADGKRLLVANAKGTTARNPNNKPDPYDTKRKHGYVLNMLEGDVIAIDIPTGKDLEATTSEVIKNNRLESLQQSADNPLAGIGLAAGKIKHVLYIIKENRTYDEVLGDLPQGNGDASLVLFGRDITPNQHALAERFVLLDNLYACGEVSGDGWVWSTQGMADAYVIRNVPYSYSNRGRKFDFEGENNGYPVGGVPATDAEGKPLASKAPFDKGAPAIPDVASTGRNLWDAAREAKISLRNYGFFLYFADGSVGLVGGPDNYPVSKGLQPSGHNLEGLTDADYRRFDLDYPDSDAPSMYFKQNGKQQNLYAKTAYGKFEMPSRFAEWNREFQMVLAKDPTGGAVPNLMLIRLPEDHASAARGGKHTPRSYIADNDYALGQIIEAVSHSPIWNSTALVVIEDDAQSGADHIDCHRTTGYVIGPWIKAHSVDHRFYNTDSMLKTIELLLGLKPLSQYDAVADPILDWDTTPSNAEPFQAIVPKAELIAELNPRAEDLGALDPRRAMAEKSEKMDFTHADHLPAREVNEIEWQTVKGPDAKMPPPRGIADDDD